jgi:N-dimethylarginine dimethylaminohydrolase
MPPLCLVLFYHVGYGMLNLHYCNPLNIVPNTKIDLTEAYKAVKELREKGLSMITTEEGEFLAKSVGCCVC